RAHETAVRGVQVDPAGWTAPELTPGVRLDLAGLLHVAADVPRRQPRRPADADHEVSEVLAHAAAQAQDLVERRSRGGHALFVLQPAAHRLHGGNEHFGELSRVQSGGQGIDLRGPAYQAAAL